MSGLRPMWAMLLLGVCIAAPSASAQSTMTGVPNAMQGFSTNRDQPIQIEATSLDVYNNDGVAVFSGNVHVIQGDTHLRTKLLKVFYAQDSKQDAKTEGARPGAKPGQKPGSRTAATRPAQAATPGPAGQQQIRRLEALDGVVVIQKEQTATGTKGIFDTQTNSVTLEGDVVVSQGTNTLRGGRLVVNLQSGVSRMESLDGRVTGSFSTNGANPAMSIGTLGGQKLPARPAEGKPAEARPAQPGGLR